MIEESVRSTGGQIVNYIRTILGTYTPSDVTSMAGADWEYIISGIILILVLWFIFRTIYLILKNV